MSREGLRYQTFSRRAFLLAGAQGLALTTLGSRLYYLAIIEGDQYKLRADKNRISLRWVAPERGEIFDRFGRKLATNRQDFRVFLIPEQAHRVTDTLSRLGRIVQIDDRRLARVERQIKRQRKFMPVTVAQGLSWKTFARVNVEMPSLPGVVTDSGLSRYYPDGIDVAHIIGYMASPQEGEMNDSPLYQLPGFKVGRQGLERRYEDQLRGKAGTRRVEVNAVGREIRELPPRQDAVRGEDISLSLDLELQKFTMDRLGEEAAGAVLVDVKNGDILAMGSSPSFDPNEFTNGISHENWQALLKDPRKPLINKPIAGLYPPGSTFKPIMALAALESGVLKPDTTHYCNGKFQLGSHTFHCWRHQGHGRVNLEQAIQQSCDVYFYKVAADMDIDNIADMARRFGLGDVFGIGIDGEKEGLVPDRDWKHRVMHDQWHLGETLNVSIGQGALLVTPLQLAVMSARIAGGNSLWPSLVRPLKGEPDVNRSFLPLDVNPLHLKVVRRGMEMVMEPHGTAHDWHRPKSAIRQAGKTGSAQIKRITKSERETGIIKQEDLPWAERDHALFIGYAPAEAPEVATGILVQHGAHGGSTAAPIARDMMDKALELKRKREGKPAPITTATAGRIEGTPPPADPDGEGD